MRVLIAEDDTVSRRILQRAVERFGHACQTADDGAEAWTYFQDGAFDVVISDWVMPRVDGLELCSKIREQPAERYTYVMLLSVLSGRGHFLEGMRAGADDYLTKPLDVEELQARLAAAQRVTTLHGQLAEQNDRLEHLLREQEDLFQKLAEAAEARGRLEGVTLATREMVHLLNNDLSLAVGAVDMLQQSHDLAPEVLALLSQVDEGMDAASSHLRELQKVVRVKTKETPMGPALDLARSTQQNCA